MAAVRPVGQAHTQSNTVACRPSAGHAAMIAPAALARPNTPAAIHTFDVEATASFPDTGGAAMARAEQAVARISAAVRDRDVLEIACGNGEFSLAVADLAAEVTCIDLDGSRLLPALSEQENVRFFQMDATAMRFDHDSFDTVVICNALFPLADRLAAVLDECMRVLRPGGLLYVISAWSLDKPIITDSLLPLAEQRRLAYRLSMDGAWMYARIRKA